MKRIHILGVCGSGKSFLSKKLSKILKIRNYDLDDIFWRGGKRKYNKKREETERQKLLNNIITKDKWIIEGCYSSWIENSIKKSDLVIILDPPKYLLKYRVITRFIKRKRFTRLKEWKDLKKLIEYINNYHKKGQPCGYLKYLDLVKKYNSKYIVLKSKKEIKDFLRSLT